MKPGDKIKAFCKIGLMRKPAWVTGKFVRRDEDLSVVSIHDQNHSLEFRHVKEWKPLSFVDGECKEIKEFAENNWDDLKEIVSSSLHHFFPQMNPVFNDEEKTITFDEDLVVGTGVMQSESIVRFEEHPCWTVTMYQQLSYSYLQPPDVDEINLGESRTNIGIAKILIDAIWRIRSEPYWESLSEKNWAEGNEW